MSRMAIVYSVVLPFMLLDLWVSLYQRICFPISGIPHVRRAEDYGNAEGYERELPVLREAVREKQQSYG
jgi:hypothetical protein